MENKTVDLKPVLAMNNAYFVKNMQECFDTVNKLLKAKSGVDYDPLFVKTENGRIKLGYKPLNNEGTKFFSDETIPSEYGSMERAVLVQSVIFEGCKEYGCYHDVPMVGAPEEGDDCYFVFTHEDVQYTFRLW